MEERNFFQKIYHFFDKLEDRVRGWLSHRTIFYGFIGGIGAVLFWRGYIKLHELVPGYRPRRATVQEMSRAVVTTLNVLGARLKKAARAKP